MGKEVREKRRTLCCAAARARFHSPSCLQISNYLPKHLHSSVCGLPKLLADVQLVGILVERRDPSSISV